MYKQHDVVKIKNLIRNNCFVKSSLNKRRPQAGDIATIVKVYEANGVRKGFELKCSNHIGGIIWQLSFAIDEIVLTPS